MLYWIAVILLLVLNGVSVALNLLMLPGNWIMVASLCLFLLIAGNPDTGPDWVTLLIVTTLAAAGEIIELFAGSAKAARAGATRRSILISLVASFVLSIAGTFVVPIPIAGTALGAIGGAAVGAFAGAWIGEMWGGSKPDQRVRISQAAMSGRLLGMMIKLAIGAAIFVTQLVSFWS